MNRHLELGIGIGFVLLMSLIILTYAIPPEPPITVRGFVFNSTAGAQMAEGTNVSLNNTNTSTLRVIYTSTSGGATGNTGFYHADINGSNGDIILVTAWNTTHFGYNSSAAASNLVDLNITINDSRLSPPIPVLPLNRSLITTRAPTFVWNNSFDRINNSGMVRNYTLDIANYPSFIQEFADPPLFFYNVSGINETNALNTTFNLTFDLAPGTWYWRVRAFQLNTSAASNYSIVFNFTILSTVACSLPNAAVDFGVLALNRSNNTLTNNPRPIEIINSGNLLQNISINATNLWNDSAAQNPSRFYQWKITDNATNSFTAANTTIFLNMSTVSQKTIENLRYANGTFSNPAARIELNITAPLQEPPGTKGSEIVLICEG